MKSKRKITSHDEATKHLLSIANYYSERLNAHIKDYKAPKSVKVASELEDRDYIIKVSIDKK